jgi:pimeloyl-ACP methyl ester carboxylesterase
MIRIFIVMLGLLLTGHRVEAAPWTLPAGIKTLEVNGYPMAFLESGTGEPVVLVHGGGTDYRTWRRRVESPPPGFRLIAVSLRHYYPERWDGKGDTFSIKQHAEDLATFIQAFGIGPVYLVGHSRGGPVVVRTAQARPLLVKKLVLMEGAFGALLETPASGDTGPGLSAIAKATKERFDRGDIEGGLELWFDREGTPGAWARRTEEDRQRTRDNTWTLIARASGKPVTCADLGGLKMPVLLLQGEKTSRRRASIVDAAHKCLPSAERATIPDAGHAMHLMNPAAFEKTLVQFLSR